MRLAGLFDLQGDPLAPESAAATLAPVVGAAEPAVELSPTLSPVTSLLRHARLALVVFLLLAPGSVLVAVRKSRPAYRAEAVLRISPLMPRVLYTGEEWRATSIAGFYNDYVRTLSQLVAERAVLEAAVVRLASAGVDWVPGGVEPSEVPNHLRARLEVKLVHDTQLLTVGIEDGRASLVAPIVSAVTESFLAQIAAEEAVENDAKVRTLMTDRRRLVGELAATHARLDTLSARLGSAILDERQNVFYQRIGVLDEGLTKLFVRRVEAEAALSSARARASELEERIPEALVEKAVEDDVAVRDTRVLAERLDRELATATAAYSKEHPLRIDGDRRRARARADVAALESRVRLLARERIRVERADEARTLVSLAERDAEGARRSETLMQKVMDSARDGLVDYGRAMFEGSQLRAQAARLLQDLAVLDKRVEELRVEARAPCRVSVRTGAVEPSKPVRDRRALAALGALAASAAAGAGAAIALGRLRPVVETPGDLEGAGFMVLASASGPPSERAAEAILRLEADAGGGRLRVLVAPVESSAEATGGAVRVAESLLGAASAHRRALLVRLSTAGDDAPPAPSPEPLANGRAVRWGPLASPETLAAVVASGEFRARFDDLASGSEACFVATPAVLASAVSWPFLANGHRAVLVVRPGRTSLKALAAAARTIREARGLLAGVVLEG